MAVTVTNASGVTTVTLSAAGDTASPQDIIAAGFGVAEGRLAMSSAHTIILKIATGATYDETGWTIILASTRYVQLDCAYGGGTWLKGYRLGQKVQGGTYMSQGAWGSTGGTNIITGTATPGSEPLIRWHNVRIDSGTSTNRQPVFLIGDNAILDIDGLVLANQDQGGANSAVNFNLGQINNLAFVKANCEIGGEGAINGLSGTGIFSTELRLAPRTQNYRVRGFTPAEEAFTELWFRGDLIPDITTLFYFLDDPNMEENFDWPNRIRKYGLISSVLDATRRLQILIRDAAGNPVSNTRIYNVSDGNVLHNVVSAGDFDEQTVFWRGTWTSTVNSYIYPNTSRYTVFQTVNVRKYGYVYEQLEFNLREQAASQPLFLREIPFILTEADVDALTGISLDHENKIVTITANANVVDLFSWYLRQLETEAHADKPVEWDATAASIDLGDWALVIDAATFTGGLTTTGTVTLQNGATVDGAVEDANGVRVTVRKSGGGNFNIAARYGTSGSYTDLGYTANTATITFTVPKGQPVEVAMWSLGYVTYRREISTVNGGVVLDAEMILNASIDTGLDVSSYLANISASNGGGQFNIVFEANMDVPGIDAAKAIVHRIVGAEIPLRASLPPTGSTIIEILADEIKVNLPAVYMTLGAAATTVTQRGYINTTPAVAIDPAYVINPRRESDNLRVDLPLNKPTLDPSVLALAVRAEMERTGGMLDGKASQASVDALPAPLTDSQTRAQVDAALAAYDAVVPGDLAALATGAQVTALGTPLQAADYVAPATAADIAGAVETAILTDGDGRAVLQAIADKIGNENVSATVIAETVRTSLRPDLAAMNTGIQRASLMVPHTSNLPD